MSVGNSYNIPIFFCECRVLLRRTTEHLILLFLAFPVVVKQMAAKRQTSSPFPHREGSETPVNNLAAFPVMTKRTVAKHRTEEQSNICICIIADFMLFVNSFHQITGNNAIFVSL